MHKDGVLILEKTDSNCCGLEHKIVRLHTVAHTSVDFSAVQD